MRNNRTGAKRTINAKFVFVGAGGYALRLLQKSGIAEAKGFGGFPIGGKFLRTSNPALAAAHRAKVYGFPPPGAPPNVGAASGLAHHQRQAVADVRPVRRVDAEVPQAGPIHRLAGSVKPGNLTSMFGVGVTQMNLVNYLVGQLLLSDADRVDALREFAPRRRDSDWETDRSRGSGFR